MVFILVFSVAILMLFCLNLLSSQFQGKKITFRLVQDLDSPARSSVHASFQAVALYVEWYL